MNIQQLRIVVELSKGRTLQDIADLLKLTQPTVSFHLRKLEEELGVELVHKQARSLRITENAQELLPYARQIIALTEEARQRMKERLRQAERKLRIGASFTPATFFMPPFLQAFQSRFPSLQLLITVNQAGKLLEMLRQFDIDAAIVSLPDTHEEGLVIHQLTEDALKLVFSPTHPLAKMETIQTEHLQQETFLLHEPGSTSRRLTDEWARENGLQFRRFMELGAIETIKEAVKFNMGVGVLPERSVIREAASGELLARSLPGYRNRRYICLAHRDEELLSPQNRAFVQFALQQMR